MINRGSSRKAWLALVAGALFAAACTGVNVSGPKITNTPITPVSASGGNFDAVEIDQANHRIYAADRDHGVDVFDITTAHARFVTAIVLPSSPNGLAIAPDLGRLYAGTANGMVEVLDINPTSPTTGKVIAEVVTGGKEVDLLDYSASRHELYASSGPDGTIASIDTRTNTVVRQIKIGNPLEQPRFNSADGMLYVTAPDADALFQIDPSTGAIKNKTTLGNCKPVGLAINPRLNQGVIACDNWTVSWDFRTSTAQTLNQAAHGDVVSYDAQADRYLVATPGPITSSAVTILGGNPIAYISSVFTGAGGKAAVYDDTNRVVYTTDIRPNRAGLLSFAIPDATPTLSSLLTLAPLAALLPLIVLVLIIVGRQADPIRRPEPLLTRAEAKKARLERLERERANDLSQA
ncbi:MAG: YncE family protein [Candidatus Dormibacteraceae bacterium]